jgi:hypothetical protein
VTVVEERTPRLGPKPAAPEIEQNVEEERRALRELIEKFRREPGSEDEGGIYRNVGRFIIRTLIRPH